MGAQIDTSEKLLFIIDKPQLNHGAVATGRPNFFGLMNADLRADAVKDHSGRETWLVCHHLSHPGLVYSYYMASGLITIVFGKCFCESCYDMILSKNDLSELIGNSRPMTDEQFQDNFINPLIKSNYNFIKRMGHISYCSETLKTWVSCSHLSREADLKKVYATGGQIFVFESYITCQDCFDKIPTDSLVDLIYEGKSMTDGAFQEKIVDPLFAINYESLEAVGHFDLPLGF